MAPMSYPIGTKEGRRGEVRSPPPSHCKPYSLTDQVMLLYIALCVSVTSAMKFFDLRYRFDTVLLSQGTRGCS